jgi:hypothetical protein
MKRKIFIYVGAHKTGTTFLHRELIKLEPQLAELDCRYDSEGVKYAKTLLARGFPIDALTLAKLQHEIALAHSEWTERNLILISEHFMGNPYTGYLDVKTVAQALPQLFPNDELYVLLSIRRQDHFLESWYNQSIKEGGFWTFGEFMEQIGYQNLDWNRIAQCYEDVLGADHVRVITYENAYTTPDLIVDAHFKGWAYDGTITPATHEPVNPSVSNSVIEMMRQANRLLPASAKTELRKILETCAPKPIGHNFGYLHTEDRTRIIELFAPSNNALAARYPHAGIGSYITPRSADKESQALPSPCAATDTFDLIALQVLQIVFRHSQKASDELIEQLAESKQKIKQLDQKHSALNSELAAKSGEIALLTKEMVAAQAHIDELFATVQSSAEGIHKQARRLTAHVVRGSLDNIRDQLRATIATSKARQIKALTRGATSEERHSNPVVDKARPFMRAQIKEWKSLPPEQRVEKWRESRREFYISSGESQKIQALKNIHAGKRCFILGNGPSLNTQHLPNLGNEITFVSNWFVNAEQYSAISPKYYCVSSHEMFGGWNKPDPKLNPDFYAAMQAKDRAATKFFSFAFRDYINDAGLFPNEAVNYVLFEKPKRVIDEAGEVNLDLTKHLDDGYTVIQTLCIPLAVHFGCTEIYLIGCDCNYGIQKPDDPKQYCYDSKLHKTSTSKFESLQRIWADNGPVFKSYEILRDTLAARGVKLINATNGGRLNVLPKVEYDSLFK